KLRSFRETTSTCWDCHLMQDGCSSMTRNSATLQYPKWVLTIGPLKPGVSPDQAITETAPVLEQIRNETQISIIEQRQEMDHLLFTPTFGRGSEPTVDSRRVSVVGRDPRFIRAALQTWAGTHGPFAPCFGRGSRPTVHSRRISVVGRDPRFIRAAFQS